MPKIAFQRPTDQPQGKRRLLKALGEDLDSNAYSDLKISVAYAKSGPLYRLLPKLKTWRAAGKTIRAVFGLDQKITSFQALEIALDVMNDVYVTYRRGITFHPKIYIFSGANSVDALIGSNNLTVGGTELNFETNVRLTYVLPGEKAAVADLMELWDCLLPANCSATTKLDAALLNKLLVAKAIANEVTDDTEEVRAEGRKATSALKTLLPSSAFQIVPPSPLPKTAMVAKGNAVQKAAAVAPAKVIPAALAVPVVTAQTMGIAMHIVPHNNGEIFLSKLAVNQDPLFFGWPFTGTTVPKKLGNPAYPQRDPDPIVNVLVYGKGDAVVFTLNHYALNTVYYSTKSEIRVTASPLVGVAPDLSIMVMRKSVEVGVDYDIDIYRPDSDSYANWGAICNQSMPNTPRRFGWF